MATKWSHLQPLVDLLVQAGNVVETGGFRVTQGGYTCVMRCPIDFTLLRGVVPGNDSNVHLAENDDMVWCSHCWATIIGPEHVDGTPLGSTSGTDAC